MKIPAVRDFQFTDMLWNGKGEEMCSFLQTSKENTPFRKNPGKFPVVPKAKLTINGKEFSFVRQGFTKQNKSLFHFNRFDLGFPVRRCLKILVILIRSVLPVKTGVFSTYRFTPGDSPSRRDDSLNEEENKKIALKKQEFSNQTGISRSAHLVRGQVTVELILLAVVLIVIAQLIINQIKNNAYLKAFAEGPAQVVANMISNGNWKRSPEESKKDHPNSHRRHFSWDPPNPP